MPPGVPRAARRQSNSAAGLAALRRARMCRIGSQGETGKPISIQGSSTAPQTRCLVLAVDMGVWLCAEQDLPQGRVVREGMRQVEHVQRKERDCVCRLFWLRVTAFRRTKYPTAGETCFFLNLRRQSTLKMIFTPNSLPGKHDFPTG